MNEMQSLFQNFGNNIQQFLPTSPFKPFLEWFRGLEMWGYLNYFIPVGAILQVLLLWTGAISIFYVYQIILRWLKVIE